VPDTTADRKPITEGLVCYDNNLTVVRVTLDGAREDHGVAWYACYDAVTGSRSPMMDGGRLSTTFRDYNGNTCSARADLREQYLALMDAGHDFPWDIDGTVACGGCGAQMVHDDPPFGSFREHAADCPVLEAQDEQERRFVALHCNA